MSDKPNVPNMPTDDQEPFIPPSIVLGLAALGLIVALTALLTQPNAGAVVLFSLAFTVLALIFWVVIAPNQAKEFVTGRGLRFGGVAIFVTALLLVFLVLIYRTIAGLNWQIDLTGNESFSLTDEARGAIQAAAADPNFPSLRIVAFYGTEEASARDQDTALFEDFQNYSNGKITYEIIDPVRNPVAVEQYAATAGEVVVAPLDEAGQPLVERVQRLTPTTTFTDLQTEVVNAILRAAAGGDFRAYFLSVEDGAELADVSEAGLSQMNTLLTEQFSWTTREVNPLELGTQSVVLNDPAATGEVIVIPGGSEPLRDEQIAVLQTFVDNGGDLVIFADPGLNSDGVSLATADNMSDFLWRNYGVRLTRDLVIDQQLSAGAPFIPVSVDLDETNRITRSVIQTQGSNAAMLFFAPHPIEIAPTLPGGVTVTALARSGPQSYTRTVAQVGEEDFGRDDTDKGGPFVMFAAVENSTVGSRLVISGSSDTPLNAYADYNGIAAAYSVIWSTGFDDYIFTIDSISRAPSPYDEPLLLTQDQARNLNFLIVIVIPFSILAVGAFVWWSGRERAK